MVPKKRRKFLDELNYYQLLNKNSAVAASIGGWVWLGTALQQTVPLLLAARKTLITSPDVKRLCNLCSESSGQQHPAPSLQADTCRGQQMSHVMLTWGQTSDIRTRKVATSWNSEFLYIFSSKMFLKRRITCRETARNKTFYSVFRQQAKCIRD